MVLRTQLKVGSYIRELRKKKGISINDLVESSKISKGYISQIENNKFIPSPEILKKLSDALDVPHMELMNVAGHTNETDMMDILQMVLISLQDELNHYDLEIDSIGEQLNRKDLDEETKNTLEKSFKETLSKTKETKKSIDDILNVIGILNKLSGNIHAAAELNKQLATWNNCEHVILEEIENKLEDIGSAAKEDSQSKVELETFFNSTQEITINGKSLSDHEKKKALQILKLTFDS